MFILEVKYFKINSIISFLNWNKAYMILIKKILFTKIKYSRIKHAEAIGTPFVPKPLFLTQKGEKITTKITGSKVNKLI